MDCVTAGPSLLLAAVCSELPCIYDCPPSGWQVGCTGVGIIAASIATTRLLIAVRPSKVLFVGTCGAYNRNLLSIGDFLTVSHATNSSIDLLESRIYRPDSEQYSWSATLSLPKYFPALTVAVTSGITRTHCGAELLSSIAAVEHLELTGVFAACHEANIPCGAILAVANYVGPEAHEQWQANHVVVSYSLINALKASGIFDLLKGTGTNFNY